MSRAFFWGCLPLVDYFSHQIAKGCIVYFPLRKPAFNIGIFFLEVLARDGVNGIAFTKSAFGVVQKADIVLCPYPVRFPQGDGDRFLSFDGALQRKRA